jgi:MFS transporter, putative metabolite:H+ symporter
VATLKDPTTLANPFTISARLDRLPPSGYLRGMVALISLGGWFEFYDLFVAGYVSLGFIKAGIFTATTKGLFDWTGFASFIASGFAGMFIGTLLFSGVSDRYGRKKTFLYSLFCHSIATFVMAFQNSPVAIDLWRFIAGLGIGVQLITSHAFISEMTPKERRGHYIAFSQFISYCSVPVAAFAAYILIPRTILALDGWRWLVMIGAIGGPIFLLIQSKLPESPRWYAAHGRVEEAEAATVRMEEAARASLGRDLTPPQPGGDQVPESGKWSEIWSRRYVARTIMLVLFNIFQTVAVYGFASWVPVLLTQQGVPFVHSLEYTFWIAILNPFGPLIAMKYADALERKWQIVALAMAIAVFGTTFAQMRNPLFIILFGSLITVANNWFGSLFHTYQAELYPTRIRGKAVGFVYSWSRLSGIFVGFVIAALLKDFGTVGVFAFIAGSMAVVALAIGILGPKTSGVSLEVLSH